MYKIFFPEIDLENIKGVLIDIDDTLYPYEPAHQKALSFCYEQLLLQNLVDPKKLSLSDFKLLYRSERKKVFERLTPQGACRSRLFAFQSIFESMNKNNAYVKAHEYENFYWDCLIGNMTGSSDALNFLKLCRTKGIKTCAVSDMQAHFQIRKLEALKVIDYIDFLTTSEEVGAEKPHQNMFKRSLAKMGLKPNDEVIMIGDSEEKDIKGAEKISIKTYKVMVQCSDNL